MNLDLLSRYRTQLMGVAILGVLMFHSSFPFEYYSWPAFITKNGYAGVEVFFLLSGFGIFFSISKSKSIKEFYKKRVLRILPYYLPIVLFFSIMCVSVGYWTIKDLVYNLLMIGFWLDVGYQHFFDWYIPAILFMYFITPLFYFFYKKNKIITMLTFCGVPLAMLACNNWITNIGIEYLYLFLYRVPLYFIGFALADYLKIHNGYQFPKISSFLFSLIFIGGVLLMSYWYFSTPNWEQYTIYGREMSICFLIVIPGCLLFSYLLSFLKNYKYPILTFLGTYTLTIYIFHERVLKIGLFMFFNFIKDNLFYETIFKILCIIVTLFLAVGWQKLIDKIIARIENK